MYHLTLNFSKSFLLSKPSSDAGNAETIGKAALNFKAQLTLNIVIYVCLLGLFGNQIFS